jgi:ElaB/YqjD/DUF883 family membrane-anchored ribosome-binding protein
MLKFAQDAELFVMDSAMSPASQLPAADEHSDLNLADSHEVHHHHHFDPKELEVTEPLDIEIIVEDLPGAPAGTKDPEPTLEVVEPEEEKDNNDVKTKSEKWDWSAHGPTGFVAWVKSRMEDVPKHSGYDSAGLERSLAYMEKLDNEISKAMRLDLDGELDANKIEEIRSKIDDGMSRLQSRLDKVKKTKKSNKKKKAYIEEDGFIKEAQKITGIQGTFVTVPLLISSIGRIIINSMVSAGHDMEDMSAQLVKKYSLNDREQLELRQYLFDSGVAMRVDLGMQPDEEVDTTVDHFDWVSNYSS